MDFKLIINFRRHAEKFPPGLTKLPWLCGAHVAGAVLNFFAKIRVSVYGLGLFASHYLATASLHYRVKSVSRIERVERNWQY